MHPNGLLQPLELPTQIWSDILTDFIERFLKVKGKTVLLVVVDRFSKYAHFIPLTHPYTTVTVAQIFFAHIVRLHGMPKSIVGGPDVLFTNNFWKELFKLTGTKLAFPSAFIINRMDRQRRSITQLKCIFDVLWRISHGAGLIGYHGRNFVITLPFTQHFTQPRSRSFMVGTTTVVVLCTRLFTGRSY